jgi:hypothetical protein
MATDLIGQLPALSSSSSSPGTPFTLIPTEPELEEKGGGSSEPHDAQLNTNTPSPSKDAS